MFSTKSTESSESQKSRIRRLPVKCSPHWDRESTVRIVCISDTHNCLYPEGEAPALGWSSPAIPEGDVLIHAGDFTNVGKRWEVERFAKWLQEQPHEHKVVIAGNHEYTFDPSTRGAARSHWWFKARENHYDDSDELKNILRQCCTYLEDSSTEILGFRLYGSPWQPEFGQWAFNLPRDSHELSSKWASIPSDTDVLITHGPPSGILDRTQSGEEAGCAALRAEVEERVRPKLHVFGHVHEGYGKCKNDSTVFVNASMCTRRYRPANAPIVVDLPVRAKQN